MLDRSSPRERLAAIVRTIVEGQPFGRPDRLDGDLREAGLTSLDLVKVVLAVEVEFGVMLDPDDMHPENFQSLDAMETLVARVQAA